MIQISRLSKQIIIPYRKDVHTLMPHAVVVPYQGENLLAMPHRTQETRLLRNMKIDAPAPITEHYNWPGFKKPFNVQIDTCAMMTMNPRAYVLNSMGTGKTKAALWAWDYLRKDGQANKLLVVAPLSTLNFTWAREAMETLSGVTIRLLIGDRQTRLKRLSDDADIYIINHDGVKVIAPQLMMRKDIDCVVLDEAAAYRNARAERSKITRKMIADKTWVWAMTGSPTPNAPTDAYGLAKLVTPATAPRSFTMFRLETMTQLSQFRWMPRPDAALTVAQYLQPSVRYELQDVNELPELVERTINVEMGLKQKKAYKQMHDTMVMDLAAGKVTAANGGVVLNKLLQTSCGYVYMDSGDVARFDNHARIEATLDLIEATDRKIIVFANYKSAVAGLALALKDAKVDFAQVTGDTTPTERAHIFNQFQNTNALKALIAHPVCMSHGLTLTAADTIVWFSPTTSLETFEQANARIRRIGQRHRQQIIMLQSTPAERAMYTRLRAKRDAQNDVLELLANLTTENL